MVVGGARADQGEIARRARKEDARLRTNLDSRAQPGDRLGAVFKGSHLPGMRIKPGSGQKVPLPEIIFPNQPIWEADYLA